MAFSSFNSIHNIINIKKNNAAATISPGTWTTLTGPSNFSNQTNNTQFMSNNGKYIYMVAVGNNYFWISTNYGNTWTANVSINNSNFASNGLFYSNVVRKGACSTSGQYVYTVIRNSPFANGVLLSTNYGNSFSFTSTADINLVNICCINSGQIVYLSGNYLSKSTNYGASFSKVTTYPGAGVTGLICNRSDGNTLYATYWNGGSGYVYCSTNGGTTFTTISTSLGTTIPFSNVICSNTGYTAYVTLESNSGNINYYIYKFINFGATKKILTTIPQTVNVCCNTNDGDDLANILWFYSYTSKSYYSDAKIYYSVDGGVTSSLSYDNTGYITPSAFTISCDASGDVVTAYINNNNLNGVATIIRYAPIGI
jgi:hypothetical protein